MDLLAPLGAKKGCSGELDEQVAKWGRVEDAGVVDDGVA
jgi:hypothetical protein